MFCICRLIVAALSTSKYDLKEIPSFDVRAVGKRHAVLPLQPTQSRVAPVSYIGLRNAGSTCYMNCLLQQLFMVPTFRKEILLLDPLDEQAATRPWSGTHATSSLSSERTEMEEEPKDNRMATGTLHEMQSIFTHLACSQCAYADATPLLDTVMDWRGAAIGTDSERDVFSFLGILFKSLSDTNSLKRETVDRCSAENNGECRSLLRRLFGINLCHTLRTAGDGTIGDFRRETTESTYALQLPVENFLGLEAALAHVLAPEEIPSFRWSVPEIVGRNDSLKEQGSVLLPTTKVVKIRRSPQHLFLHLKRFRYDSVGGRIKKVHNRFEFPREFDLEVEGGNDESRSGGGVGAMTTCRLKYSLGGIIMHEGSATGGGHYYSFVRERFADNSRLNATSADSERWFEFNDTKVTEWDADAKMEQCCFGCDVVDDQEESKSAEPASAIMLIYDLVRNDGSEHSQREQGAESTTSFSSNSSSLSQDLSSVFPQWLQDDVLATDYAARVHGESAHAALMELVLPPTDSMPRYQLLSSSSENVSRSSQETSLLTLLSEHLTNVSPVRHQFGDSAPKHLEWSFGVLLAREKDLMHNFVKNEAASCKAQALAWIGYLGILLAHPSPRIRISSLQRLCFKSVPAKHESQQDCHHSNSSSGKTPSHQTPELSKVNAVAAHVARELFSQPVMSEQFLVAMHSAGRAASRIVGAFVVSGVRAWFTMDKAVSESDKVGTARAKRPARGGNSFINDSEEGECADAYVLRPLFRLLVKSLPSQSKSDATIMPAVAGKSKLNSMAALSVSCNRAICEESSALLLKLLARRDSVSVRVARAAFEEILGPILTAFEKVPHFGISLISLAVALLPSKTSPPIPLPPLPPPPTSSTSSTAAVPEALAFKESEVIQEKIQAEWKRITGAFGTEMVGQRLQVRKLIDSSSDVEWRDGVITKHHAETAEHEITYDSDGDGGPIGTLRLSCATWRAVA